MMLLVVKNVFIMVNSVSSLVISGMLLGVGKVLFIVVMLMVCLCYISLLV